MSKPFDTELDKDASNESGVINPVSPEDTEKLKNIRNTQPSQEEHIGRDTTGQGQPDFQKINQEQSLPQTSVPVEKNFTKAGEFYDPMEIERLNTDKDSAERGAQKTE
jgi:hypothetical protein